LSEGEGIINMKSDYTIDVILTLYRRPESLEQQLEAIKKQTVKPQKIFLYQDGID